MKKKLLIPLVLLLATATMAGGAILAVGVDRALGIVGLGPDPDSPSGDHADETGVKDDHGKTGAADAKDGHGKPEGDGHGAPEMTQNEMPLLPFPEMIVNVTDTTASGRQTSRFLKVNLLLVYDEAEPGADQLGVRELYIRDAFQSFLRSLNVADLQGARGIALLKAELLRRARAVGHTDAPRDILISDLVIQ